MIEAAYARALRRVISPGITVLDLGGDFARRAVLACRLGACRVYSVQAPSARRLAEQVAAVNCCSDHIEFIDEADGARGLADAIDVVLAELPGGLPVHASRLAAGRGRAQRMWRPDAVTVPRREKLWAAVVDAPHQYRRHVGPWTDNCDWPMDAARRLAVNTWSRCQGPARLLVDPCHWATIDYGAGTPGDAHGQIEWTLTQGGLSHGLLIWSEIVLADDETITSSSDDLASPIGRAFFPWSEPLRLEVGDSLAVTIDAAAIGSNETWSWSSRIVRQNRELRQSAQSSFLGNLELPGRLKKTQSDYIPRLCSDGHILRMALTLMNGRTSRDDIARALHDAFPESLRSTADALVRVEDVRRTYAAGTPGGQEGRDGQEGQEGQDTRRWRIARS